MEIFGEDGDIGLLLDLYEGTLSVFKDGRRCGIMKSGLSGEYCWMLTLGDEVYEQTVCIERGLIHTV